MSAISDKNIDNFIDSMFLLFESNPWVALIFTIIVIVAIIFIIRWWMNFKFWGKHQEVSGWGNAYMDSTYDNKNKVN